LIDIIGIGTKIDITWHVSHGRRSWRRRTWRRNNNQQCWRRVSTGRFIMFNRITTPVIRRKTKLTKIFYINKAIFCNNTNNIKQ
jgi:hypothetical protein